MRPPLAHTGLAVLAGAQTSLKLWDQCGGRGGICYSLDICADEAYDGFQCPAGSGCTRHNEW